MGPALVAGLDAAYDAAAGSPERGAGRQRCWGAAVLWDVAAGVVLEQAAAESIADFPYAPGLLSPRELPVLLEALRLLRRAPNVLLCDAHGRAHPLRFGLACSLAKAAGLASVGCAKNVLVGEYRMPGSAAGSREPLVDGAERIGTVLRTREGVRPVFVSVGAGLDLPEAESVVLACVRGHRIPEPLRRAHILARRAARAARITGSTP